MADTIFADRVEAGRQLARRLHDLENQHPLILALPRGGLPVAHEIAMELNADLDLLMVRKIGVPWQPELALAAVVDGHNPQVVVNQDIADLIPLPPDYLEKEIAKQLEEIEVRRLRYLGGRGPIPVQGRTIVIVDDGIATGATMRVALKGLRRKNPARMIVAIPVAPADTMEKLESEADLVVCLAVPDPFLAVGAHYRDFEQVEDAEVIDIMSRHQNDGRYTTPPNPQSPSIGPR